MNPSRREIIEKFFRRAEITVDIDGSPAAQVSCRKNEIVIEIKNPILVMSLGLDLDMLKKGGGKNKSVIRKAIKELGFKLKLRYKLFEIDL